MGVPCDIPANVPAGVSADASIEVSVFEAVVFSSLEIAFLALPLLVHLHYH
mgnify:CR=1 FL=1